MQHFFSLRYALSVIVLTFAFFSCRQNIVIHQISTNNIAINPSSPVDSTYIRQIEPYKKQIDSQMNKVIGYAPVDLITNRHDVESPMGNFVADLLRHQTSIIYGKPVDIAMVNNGGLRVPIIAGNVSVGNIYELMPFENEAMILTITGKQLVEFFDYEKRYKRTSISNMKIVYKNDALSSVLIGNQAVEDTKIYTIATYDYLANGGDEMSFLKDLPRLPMGKTVRDLIIKHIEDLHKEGKKVEGRVEGRVIFE
jgi:2',3'-cyclic-nucleotide 2'-phosphodiesterase (5'-nucleotidase family)